MHRRVPAEIVPLVLYLAVVAYFLSVGRHGWFDFPLDDAWIHRVYARSFALLRGFEYNRGAQEAGSTSPLWVIVSAPAHWLEPFGVRAVVVAVKAIGVLLGALVVRGVTLLARELTGARATAVVAGVLMALAPRLPFEALAGMENLLLVALWLALTRAYAAGRWGRAAVFLGLMPITRPEALALVPLFLAGTLVHGGAPRLRWRDAALVGVVLSPMALWCLFCHFTNGHWLPTTFYVKAHPFRLAWSGLVATLAIVSRYGLLGGAAGALGLVGVAVAARPARGGRAALVGLLLAPLVYLAAVAGTRVLVVGAYYWERWLVPAALVLTGAAAIGLGHLLVSAVASLRGAAGTRIAELPRSRLAAASAGVLALVALAWAAPALARGLAERRARLASDSRSTYLTNVRAGQWLARHTPLDARVGANDAGAIRYFGRRHTLDLLGLNSAALAFGGRLRPEDVDWLAVFPSWFRPGTFAAFALRVVIEIPPRDYTVCVCPGQNHLEILERRPTPASAPAPRPGPPT